MVHQHVNVGGGEAGLVLGGLVATLVLLSLGDSSGGILGSGSHLLLGELLGLGLLETSVGVVELELAEDGERLAILRLEHLGVVHNEDKAVALAHGDAGHTAELLHADLQEGLAALLLATVELVSTYITESVREKECLNKTTALVCRVSFIVTSLTLVFEFGHFFLLVV